MPVVDALETIAEEEEKAAVLDELAASRVPVWYTEGRHSQAIVGGGRGGDESWKNKERMKTLSVALVVCLNIGVDPPDVVKPHPCARDECWLDTLSMSPLKALESVGKALQDQYSRWQPRARYKLSLDPTVDDVKKLAMSLRRNAKDERVLFHYNGHGVPKPTDNGEIWLFNKNFTQYIPLSLYDLQQWLGSPSVLVYDANYAGLILESMAKFATEAQPPILDVSLAEPNPSRKTGASVGFQLLSVSVYKVALLEEVIQLAACGTNEMLPTCADVPADLFTSCLTTPIKTAVLCYVVQNKLNSTFPAKIWERLPGSMADRRTLLGELNWIFTAITDTIAWNTLPRHLFQKLFRQDLLVASLFRNFLLAERVMRSYNCTPMSAPRLPVTVEHPLWEAWDYALDTVLTPLQLPAPARPLAGYTHSDFFASQLRAFEVWLQFGYKHRQPPQQLPVVLQVLLSQVHRVKALELLGRFLDLGPWAVSLALSVGIFPYVLKLLLSKDRELKPLLSFIWAKILAVDPACHRDLVKEEGQIFFVDILRDPAVGVREKIVPAFILSALMDNFAGAQEKLRNYRYLDVTLGILRDWTPGDASGGMVHMWLLIGLGRLWTDYSEARWQFLRNFDVTVVGSFLAHPIPEVRAAAAFSLGTLVANESSDSATATQRNATTSHILVAAVGTEGSVLVRKELAVALAAFLADFEPAFVSLSARLLRERAALHPPPKLPIMPARTAAKLSAVDSPATLGHRFSIAGLSRIASYDASMSPSRAAAKASPSPPPTDAEAEAKLLGDLRQLLESRVSRNIHESVLLTFIRLAGDPFVQLRNMAKKILDRIIPQAEKIYAQQEALKREMSVGGGGSAARALARRQVSQPPVSPPASPSPPSVAALAIRDEVDSPKATFLVGSPRRGSLNDSVDSLPVVIAAAKRTPSRERNPAGTRGFTPTVLPPTPVPAPASSPSPGASESGKREALLTTEFVAWCSGRFTQPLLGTVDAEDGRREVWDLSPMENYHSRTRWAELSDWSASTVQSLIDISRVEREAMESKTTRMETQKWVQRLDEEPLAMKLSPLASHLFITTPSATVQLWDWESAQKKASFRNGNEPGEHTTWLQIVNPVTHSFCMTATDLGTVRVWDLGLATNAHISTELTLLPSTDGVDWDEDDDDREPTLSGSPALPRLVTAWELLGGLVGPAPVFTWEEDSGRLLAGGAFPFIRLWDAVAEAAVEDLSLPPNVYVRSISADTSGHRLIAAGCDDGSVRLFDRRLGTRAANVTTLRHFSRPIRRVELEPTALNPRGRVIAAASEDDGPGVRIWEPRMYQDPVVAIPLDGAGVGDMAVHARGNLIAVATKPKPNSHPAIAIFNFKGKRVNTIRYHEGMMGQRIGAISTLAFHPYRLSLAAAGQDHIVALYGLNS